MTLSDDIKGFDLDHVRHERQIVVEVPDLPVLLLTAGVNLFDQHRRKVELHTSAGKCVVCNSLRSKYELEEDVCGF